MGCMRRERRDRFEVLSTAWHEAGHAVTAAYLDVPFVRVSIVRDPDSMGHFLHSEHRDPLRFSGDNLRAVVVASLAGRPAQLLVDESAPKSGDLGDYQVANDFIKDARPDWTTQRRRAYLATCQVEAHRLVRTLTSGILLVSDALLRHDVLTGAQVRRLLRDSHL